MPDAAPLIYEVLFCTFVEVIEVAIIFDYILLKSDKACYLSCKKCEVMNFTNKVIYNTLILPYYFAKV